MTIFAWVIRLVLLTFYVAVLVPLGILVALVSASPVAFALFLFVLALTVVGIMFALAAHVLGSLIDVVLVLGLIGIAWKWPRGMRGRFIDKLRFAVRALRIEVEHGIRRLTGVDIAILGGIALVIVLLSLSSGVIHFFLTIAVVLLVIGIVWKWPRNPRIRFTDKLRLALRALYMELRRISRSRL